MSKYCAGLPAVRSRALTASEMTEVRRAVHGLQVMALAAVVGLVAALLAWAILLLVLAGRLHVGDSLVLWLSGPAFAAIMCPLGLRAYRRATAVGEDISSGRVLVFEGIVWPDPLDRLQRALLRQRLLRADADGSDRQTIEALECGDWVLRVNGSRPRDLTRARIGGRDEADPVPPFEGGGPRRRALTSGEQTELRVIAGKLLPLTLCAVVVTVAAAAAILTHIEGYRVATWALAFGSFALVCDLGLVLCLPGLMRLARDSRGAQVQVVDSLGGDDAAGHRVALEVLPLSGRVWTVEGYPAEWRRTREKADSR